MDIEKVKDRVAKLLATAGNISATDGEVENALRAARSLMQAYHLEEADCAAKDGQPEDDRFDRQKTSFLSSRRICWECNLAWFICEFLGSVQYYTQRGSSHLIDGQIKATGQFCYYGPADEIPLAIQLHEELATVIVAMAKARYGSWARGDGATYAEGFVQGLRSQLSKADREARKTETGTALAVRCEALVTAKKAKAKTWLATDQGVRLGRGSGLGGSRGSLGARSQGRADGKAYDVSRPSSRKAIGG